MTAGATRSVNCPSCGAGQDILGGGRVMVHVCSYCGSALDALQDFKSIATYGEAQRPTGALALGTEGMISGVPFQVIGIVRWTETYHGRTWRWIDHQLFSPTHGYGWLTREASGHVTFTRKSRKRPSRWLTPTMVEVAETRPSRWLGDTRYRYYETSTAMIDYLEGSFNWVPEVGWNRTAISMIAHGSIMTLSQGGAGVEQEVELTRLLKPEEAKSFGLVSPATGHPLNTPPPWKHRTFVATTTAAFATLALLLLVAVGASSGRGLASLGPVPIESLPVTMEVDVPSEARLLSLQVRSDVSNGWAAFEVGLEQSDGEVVAEGEVEVSYYFGRDADGSWTEGSHSTFASFPAPPAGAYAITIDLVDHGRGSASGDLTSSEFFAAVASKRASWQPLASVAGVFAALFSLTLVAEVVRRASLLRGSDWSED